MRSCCHNRGDVEHGVQMGRVAAPKQSDWIHIKARLAVMKGLGGVERTESRWVEGTGWSGVGRRGECKVISSN
eukprot:2631868-Pleurochrysis_carterae.AAC.1